MPLLGRKVFTHVKPLTNVDPSEKIYTIKHTNEQFRSKEEYEKHLKLYAEEVWTCQCTGHINMTHEEALKSEQDKFALLKAQFPIYQHKPVLELVHHSNLSLDNLVDQTWTKIHQVFVLDEPVVLKVKASCKAVKGTIIKVDTSGVDTKNCNSPSSGKENKDEGRSGANASSPRKWTPPKLQPYKYSIKLDGEDKIISSIPAENLGRTVRPPGKDLVKLFVRSHALRFGANGLGPWVVEESLVKKYSLPSKFADMFFASPSKVASAPKKPGSDSGKKRKSGSKAEGSSAKKLKLDKKASKSKLSSSPLKRNSSTNLKGVSPKRGRPASPKKSFTPKKKSESPKKSKKEIVVLDSDSDSSDSDSSEDVCLADLKPLKTSPVKSSQSSNTPTKSNSRQSTPKKSKSPLKQKTPTKADKKNKEKKKEQEKKSPKKSKSTPKKMKQMTLFDMPKKGNNKSPKKTKPKPPSPTKQPFIVQRLKNRLNDKDKTRMNQILNQCVKDLTAAQRKNLPPEVKDLIMQRYEKNEEKKKLKAMTPAEREEYVKEKKKEYQKTAIAKQKEKAAAEKKRFEDMTIKGKALPVPKLVPTPDGMPNELFGEVAMLTEFISCYKGLLMPDDEYPVMSDALMKALGSGNEGFTYLSRVVVILLQTLLQDQIAEDYKEISMPLSDIAVNQFTASELVRLVLRRHDSEDERKSNADSEDCELPDEDEVSEQLIETLETSELFELTPEEKLEVVKGLVSRLMSSYSVQDYMNQKQVEAANLWKQRIAHLKDKNDRLKEEKKKKKEAKTAKTKTDDEKNKGSGSSEGQAGINISTFYGGGNGDKPVKEEVPAQDDDLASVVKRRRVMAARAAVEKQEKENEDKIRREKENEETRKTKLEKDFNDGIALAKTVYRLCPIGTDRNHNRYWVFQNTTPGLYVEKGWAHQDISYNVKDAENKSESDCDSDTSEESKMPLKSKDGEETTFPHTGQNLWFVYDSLKDLDGLLENLNKQGIRESALKAEITKNYNDIKRAIYACQRNGGQPNDDRQLPTKNELRSSDGPKEMFEGFKQELLELESKLRNGGLGGVDHYAKWEDELEAAKTIPQFAKCLCETQEYVTEKYFKGLMAVMKPKPKVKKEEQEESDDDSEEEEKEGEKEEKPIEMYCPFTEKWKEAVESCSTLSRLHLLMGMLESCIKWEKSAENAKCKICRKKGDDAKLLLCDDCNQAFHLYCLRPAILDVPTGDWFCPSCVPLSQRQCRRKTNYREMAGESSEDSAEEADSENEEEESEAEIEHDSECIVCGGDEDLALCSSCPSAFHLFCHEPPLRHTPRSNWICQQCKTGVKIKKKEKSTDCDLR